MTQADPAAAPDHLALRSLVEGVRRALGRLLAASSPATPVAREAGEILERFENELQRHFAWEEADGGFFADVVARAPNLDRSLRALREEHLELTHALTALMDRVRWAGVSAESWQAVAESFDDLARELARHETAEDGIVAEALTLDEGGG